MKNHYLGSTQIESVTYRWCINQKLIYDISTLGLRNNNHIVKLSQKVAFWRNETNTSHILPVLTAQY